MSKVKKTDVVVIVTNTTDYNYPGMLADAKLIVDTRDALGKLRKNNPKAVRL